MPAFTVKDEKGATMTFAPDELTAPTIFIFYRGGWSSDCRRYLRRLQDTEWTLRELGFEVVFLSADRPQALRAETQLADLDYNLFSDSEMQAARALGICFGDDYREPPFKYVPPAEQTGKGNGAAHKPASQPARA